MVLAAAIRANKMHISQCFTKSKGKTWCVRDVRGGVACWISNRNQRTPAKQNKPMIWLLFLAQTMPPKEMAMNIDKISPR